MSTWFRLEFRALLDRVFQTYDYEASIMALGGGDADPNPEMNVWLSSGGTHLWHLGEPKPATDWEAQIDQLMQKQMVELKYSRRKHLYDQVQEIIGQNLPCVFLATPNILVGAKKNLANFRPAILEPTTLWNVEHLYFRQGGRLQQRCNEVKQALVAREVSWSNERLVRECRKGNQAAWSRLIEKYKNLIFSIPIKFGLSREDAADIFQAVCVDLLSDLAQLREPQALPKWLMQMSYHKCLHWKKQRLNLFDDANEIEDRPETGTEELPEEMLYQVQREQKRSRCYRSASTSMSPDDRNVVL